MRLKKVNSIFVTEEINQVGTYSGLIGRNLYKNIAYKENKKISEGNSFLNEAIDYEFEKEESGGIIVFSTDVNAIKLSSNALINWIKQKITSLKNKITAGKKIDKAASTNGAVAWTVGHYLEGRYKSHSGKSFSENSLSLEIIGISSEQLIKIAEQLCEAFSQESVLVKDFSSSKIYLVNAE